MNPQIKKDIEIEDLVRSYPASIKFLANKSIKCIACGEPIWGILEEAAMEKGYSEDEISAILVELNALLANQA